MNILICTDGSARSSAAVTAGGNLARALPGGRTRVLGVAERGRGVEPFLEEARRRLESEFGVQASVLAVEGDAIERIVQASEGIDLVVLGGERSGLQPSKIYTLLRRVPAPVLVAAHPLPEIRKVLICSGGARHTEPAVRFGGRIARALRAGVTLFHVMAQPPALFQDLEDVAAEMSPRTGLGRALRAQVQLLEDLGLETELVSRYGLVVEEIEKAVRQGGYQLVVAGSHPGSHGFLMADVTRVLLERLDCTVLVVRTVLPKSGLVARLKSWIGLTA